MSLFRTKKRTRKEQVIELSKKTVVLNRQMMPDSSHLDRSGVHSGRPIACCFPWQVLHFILPSPSTLVNIETFSRESAGCWYGLSEAFRPCPHDLRCEVGNLNPYQSILRA